MTSPARAALAAFTLCFLAPLGLTACGDDANDGALQAQRLADRLAAERAATVPDAAPDVSVAPPASAHHDAAPDEPTSEPAPVVTTGVVVAVTALDNSFRPQNVEARVGDAVVWENRGRNEHDVLSIEGTLADGSAWGITVDEFQPGDIYSHVFTEPGEYRYYCTIHGNTEVGMVGTVVVSN